MNKIPNKNTGALKDLVGSKVEGFSFCGMKDCKESPVDINGIHVEATWGLIIHIEKKDDIVFTWGEDSRIGDPFFIHAVSTDEFIDIDSLEQKDASKIRPCCDYVDKRILSIAVHTYPTNYGNSDSWHDVPWGIELGFGDSLKMLIGALHHGDFMNYLICADEVVVIFDSKLITSVIKAHSTLKSEWFTYDTRCT